MFEGFVYFRGKNMKKCCRKSLGRDTRYQYWREVQRNQLGISAHLLMVFASGILGYIINYLLLESEVIFSSLVLFTLGMFLLLLSIVFYSLFSLNRLSDFRRTAKLTSQGKSEKAIGILTRSTGERTWCLFYLQLGSLALGFIVSLIAFGIIIY